jgi:hypothetical protein
LEIHYDPDRKRWYTYPLRFQKRQLEENGTNVPRHSKGGLVAGIDTGVNNLNRLPEEHCPGKGELQQRPCLDIWIPAESIK